MRQTPPENPATRDQSSPITLLAEREVPPFGVDVVPDRGRIIVAPHGEVDLATVERVRASLDELELAGFEQIVLDLRQVTFLDSTGLKLILEQVRKDGIDFAVIRGDQTVQRVFEVSGVQSLIRFVDR